MQALRPGTLLCPERYLQRKLRQLDSLHAGLIVHNMTSLMGDGKRFVFATACSGSENQVLWFSALVRNVRSISLRVPLRHARASPHEVLDHVFSCQLILKKAKDWILQDTSKSFCPKLLFPDIATLSHTTAFDIISNSMQPVPSCHGLVAGTSCVDFSSQKGASKDTVLSGDKAASTYMGW